MSSPVWLPKKTTTLYSFDGTEKISTSISQPDKYSSLFATLKNETRISIKGSGLSPCMASGMDNGHTIESKFFSRILFFDSQKQLVTVESGIKIGNLLSFLKNRHFWLSVLPGHPNISIGGCLAFDVHGKGNGYFSDIVESFRIFHPTHGEIECSRGQNELCFYLTLGGMGASGYITDVTLKITPLNGASIIKEKHPVKNLMEAAELMKELKPNNNQVYSWNDLSKSQPGKFGQGFIYTENFGNQIVKGSDRFEALSAESRRSSFLKVARPLMNSIINNCYAAMESIKPKTQFLGLFEGAFPIAGKEFYYKCFGPNGFREFQIHVPFENWKAFARDLELLSRHHKPDFTLGSLKILEGKSRYLTFCRTGVVLALNVPESPRALSFLGEVDRLMIKHDGLPNLSKDSRLTGQTIRDCFAEEYEKFIVELKHFDAKMMFNNQLLTRALITHE